MEHPAGTPAACSWSYQCLRPRVVVIQVTQVSTAGFSPLQLSASLLLVHFPLQPPVLASAKQTKPACAGPVPLKPLASLGGGCHLLWWLPQLMPVAGTVFFPWPNINGNAAFALGKRGDKSSAGTCGNSQPRGPHDLTCEVSPGQSTLPGVLEGAVPGEKFFTTAIVCQDLRCRSNLFSSWSSWAAASWYWASWACLSSMIGSRGEISFMFVSVLKK